MAIEKMVLLKIVGSLENMHDMLRELVFCENAHLNLNVENSSAYNNYLVIHQYESEIFGQPIYHGVDPGNIHNSCSDCLSTVETLAHGLDVELVIDKKFLLEKNYSFEDARSDLGKINSLWGSKISEINKKKKQIEKLAELRTKIDSVTDKSIQLNEVADLNYFDYEIGTFSAENKSRLKRNYENLSAIVLRIGVIKSSAEDLYMIIYPKQFKDETYNLLKSLNWNKLVIPKRYCCTIADMIKQIDAEIVQMQNEIKDMSASIEREWDDIKNQVLKIYNVFKLEDKLAELEARADFSNNSFVLDIWVNERDKSEVEKAIASVSEKYLIDEKSAKDFGNQVVPPTKLKNNWFSWPFEMIVKMYGLPAYHEIDPTPFLAITYCLAWGIMFGDIGQGLVYLLAGVFLMKKMPAPGHILMRLGGFSIVFGFVYGSFFGLEKKELPWLPGLLEGGPLDPKNIPSILAVGVLFGVIVLTVSFVIGIINALKKHDIEEGIFGKNGVAGYLFFISLVFTLVSLTGIINISTALCIAVLLISLVVMILKEPITNLVLKKSPLIHGEAGSYFTEAIFEGIETILNALSNAISFVRVGAFALNHAGLFLAFLVMSEVVTNPIAKIFILFLGNVLILTLEGLIVFIQGLRLQYYEMFSKYFEGGGIEFKPIKLNN
ncbi:MULTISPECIES: V-type ATP synthase subunit I [unclassified Sedimentibacter]|uniref:V-type ATP synthase subunit I n=1 Tax=unclassified Sedimentibacter TaxID=2649220 RepID=UPI0027E19C06|nr:V-type ATPase 116kDa subunit family protein [Sedimentibacter sp. MB35-C1]WMJ76320.1 V-type ATPase 116kDa subunit family protein [Sedimentibacter sp. MB35-C1]